MGGLIRHQCRVFPTISKHRAVEGDEGNARGNAVTHALACRLERAGIRFFGKKAGAGFGNQACLVLQPRFEIRYVGATDEREEIEARYTQRK